MFRILSSDARLLIDQQLPIVFGALYTYRFVSIQTSTPTTKTTPLQQPATTDFHPTHQLQPTHCSRSHRRGMGEHTAQFGLIDAAYR